MVAISAVLKCSSPGTDVAETEHAHQESSSHIKHGSIQCGLITMLLANMGENVSHKTNTANKHKHVLKIYKHLRLDLN
jgi:hypothetical protein